MGRGNAQSSSGMALSARSKSFPNLRWLQRAARRRLGSSPALRAQDKWYAVEKFGKYSHMLGPGLSFGGCDVGGCCLTYRSITSRVEQIMVTVSTKTKDNVFVTAQVAVQQSVKPEATVDAMYKLTNVHAQIDSYVADVVRSSA